MKFLVCLLIGLVVTSCASRPFEEESKQADKMMEHLSQDVKYSGGDFPDRFNESGVKGSIVVAVGKSVHELNKSEKMAASAAVSDAKFQLINSGPTTFTSEVVKRVSTELGDTEEFDQKDISITKVRNLKGIQIKQSDVICKKRIEPTQGRAKYKYMRECRAVATVKLGELLDAYDFTINGNLKRKTNKKEISKLLMQR